LSAVLGEIPDNLRTASFQQCFENLTGLALFFSLSRKLGPILSVTHNHHADLAW